MSVLTKTVRKVSDSMYLQVKEWIKSEFFFSAVHTNDYHSLVVESWAHVWGEFLLNTCDTWYLVPIINNSNNNNNNNSTKWVFMQELYPWEIPKSWYPFPWTYSTGFFVMLPGNFYHKKRQHQNDTAWLHGNLDFMKKHRKWTQWLSSQAGYYYVLTAGGGHCREILASLFWLWENKYIKMAKNYQSKTLNVQTWFRHWNYYKD